MEPLLRSQVIPEEELPPGDQVVAEGRALASDWGIGNSVFLDYYQVSDEAEYKRKCMQSGHIMQHAHMGFRDKDKSCRAFAEIHEAASRQGARVDRFGLCLDWSMGFPQAMRHRQMRGTGLILNGPEEFAEVANAAPAATHFGDFVLGFPAALENTQAALSAGSTVIGNLGQYFTFRLPDWQDDISTTRSTLAAIGLMAAQPVTVMVHSNLDDGFAAVFEDLSCAVGAVLLECYIVEQLAGATMTHCYGHHYSTPLLRLAFQHALASANSNPGSMIYGNTVSYRGSNVQNYASLGSYLMLDIIAQQGNPSGHAINPVPVTENRRIPEVNEIIDAQVFASQLAASAQGYMAIYQPQSVQRLAGELLVRGRSFFESILRGLENGGFNTRDPFEMLLAIRRIGGKRLEQLYGPGSFDNVTCRRVPLVRSDTLREIDHAVQSQVEQVMDDDRQLLSAAGLRIAVATTDVHEHSKQVVEGVLRSLGIMIIDGGVSARPDELAVAAEGGNCDAIALSTYNGVALNYFCQLRDNLEERGLRVPVMIGGQLNEIPDDTADSLPVDVSARLAEEGALVCRAILDMLPALKTIAESRQSS